MPWNPCLGTHKEIENDGMITVGKPKVWRYDRVYATLDGLLRDVDAIKLNGITSLDPNKPNAAMLDFLQQLLNGSVSASRTSPASKTSSATQSQGSSNSGPTSIIDLKSLASQVTSSNGQSLPANKQMETFIELLHERLAQQLSVIYDDYTRQGNDLYLVQFDVGVYPSKYSKGKVAKVQFDVSTDGKSCTSLSDGIKAYELYPSTAAYNITQFYGKSNHTGIRGAVSYLAGLGGTLEYQRQRDQLRASVNQSAYVSGFGAGTCSFGWYYAPNPFEDMVSPGLRTSYLLLLVPKQADAGPTEKITMNPSTGWVGQDDPSRGTVQPVAWESIDLPFSEPRGLQIAQIEYSPVRLPQTEAKPNPPPAASTGAPTAPVPTAPVAPSPSAPSSPKPKTKGTPPPTTKPGATVPAPPAPSAPAGTTTPDSPTKPPETNPAPPATQETKDAVTASMQITFPSPAKPSAKDQEPSSSDESKDPTASVQITFREVIDPNLIVIANGALIKRVRDTRGRGTAVLPSDAAGSQGAATFGLLESDKYGPDTWIATGPRAIQINLSLKTATSDAFPVIVLTNAGASGNSLAALAVHADEIRIGDEFFNLKPERLAQVLHSKGQTPSLIPQSLFLPMFLNPTPWAKILAFVDTGDQLRIKLVAPPAPDPSMPVLSERAHAVLRREPNDTLFALTCHSQESQDLLCDLPRTFSAASESGSANVWNVSLQQPEYSDGKTTFHGIAAHSTVRTQKTELVFDPNYDIKPTIKDNGEISSWEVRMPIENLTFPISLALGNNATAVACECATKFGPQTQRGVPCSPQAVMRDPSAFQEDDYVVCEEGKPVSINMVLDPQDIARNWSKCHITVRSDLGRPTELVAVLPDLAPEIRPDRFSSLNSDTAGFFKISGKNLQAINGVYLWDCGHGRLPVIHATDAIYFAAPKSVKSPCPVTLLMGEADPKKKSTEVCAADGLICIEPLGPDGNQLTLFPPAKPPQGNETKKITRQPPKAPPNPAAQNHPPASH
jgi:hypothetical protein